MAERDQPPSLSAPFDHGVFLLHCNRGREAFHEGRYAEARRELENAQKLRPEHPDVLNLLGLVYFKTNAFPEAEVIYRRLVRDNSSVFTLHSNLGLILFKQGKFDEAEQVLQRAIELRPNYAKSHLYLGLLYRQRRRYKDALDHLRFAGADKLVREVEAEIKQLTSAVVPPPAAPKQPPAQSVTQPLKPSDIKAPEVTTLKVKAMKPDPDSTLRQAAAAARTQPAIEPTPELPKTLVPEVATAATSAGHTAARKLQDAVDNTVHAEEKRIDLGRRIEGASKTFALHENGFLEINFARSVQVKRGTVSSYSGNLKFVAESGLLGTSAQTLIKATGQGKIFLYEKGRKTFLLDLNEEFIYVEGSNLLALEETLTYRVEPIYDASYERKIDTVKIFGRGSLAISTSIEPLTLRVTREYPLSISSNALVAWTGNLIPTVVDDSALHDVMIKSTDDRGFKIRFEGEGVVVSES
ncbi:MAG TPA: tetratricopeptide repeat protein [Thermoanaerobaculia bacterium]